MRTEWKAETGPPADRLCGRARVGLAGPRICASRAELVETLSVATRASARRRAPLRMRMGSWVPGATARWWSQRASGRP